MSYLFNLRAANVGVRTSGLGACKIYSAVKFHFGYTWEISKYGVNFNISDLKYNTRKDRAIFERISLKYTSEQIYMLFLSNALEDNLGYVGDALTEEGTEIFVAFKTKVNGIDFTFSNDVKNICNYCISNNMNIKNLFDCTGDHPLLIKMYLKKYICIETILILNSFMNFVNKFDEHIADPLWEDISGKIKKYENISSINKELARDKTLKIIKLNV